MAGKTKNNLKKFIGIFLVVILANVILILPLVTMIIYEVIFGARYETSGDTRFFVEDFDGLQVERSDFISEGKLLAGYQYKNDKQEQKGVVVLAHGLGGGGHNTYMPLIDCFTSNGYYVFTYDATGNDNSEGKDVDGFPQGIIDLDNAICHVATLEEYEDLPLFLVGHSWGGYSVGNVLNFHPEVKAAVIIAGFNESENLLQHYSEKYVGDILIDFLMLYVEGYEQLKFGKEFTDITAVEGMKNTTADILIVHSKDDTNVPTEYGYDLFYDEFGNSERFKFVLYEDKGHSFELETEHIEQIIEMFDENIS